MEIKKSEFIISAVTLSGMPEEGKSEFLFLGRSNVGKSSLINALTNRKSLARVSSNPGKTDTLNFYLLNDLFYLVDAPGYGYARVSKNKKETYGKMIEEYLNKRLSLKCSFLLVDFKIPPQENDIIMFNYLKETNKESYIILTKADKVKNKDYKKNLDNVLSSFNVEKDHVIVTSSEKRKGISNVLNIMENYINLEQ
jgi:GTP-binding protein